MSFRNNNNIVKVVLLPDNQCGTSVVPPKGRCTLYWWWKGDEEDRWIKADLYGSDGDLLSCGILADSYNELIDYIKDAYRIKGIK